MTSTHAPGLHSQVGRNHVADIKRDMLGRASATNPSGLPNAVVQNRGYDKAKWGEYCDTFWVM